MYDSIPHNLYIAHLLPAMAHCYKVQYFIHQDPLRNPVTDDVVKIYDQYMPIIVDFDQLGPHKRRPAQIKRLNGFFTVPACDLH